MNCLYCGVETGTGGSHTSTPACLAALSRERDRLKHEVRQRSLSAEDAAADVTDRARAELSELGPAKAGPYEIRQEVRRGRL